MNVISLCFMKKASFTHKLLSIKCKNIGKKSLHAAILKLIALKYSFYIYHQYIIMFSYDMLH